MTVTYSKYTIWYYNPQKSRRKAEVGKFLARGRLTPSHQLEGSAVSSPRGSGTEPQKPNGCSVLTAMDDL